MSNDTLRRIQALQDPWYFLKYAVITADNTSETQPLKRAPIDRIYLKRLVDLWKNERLICINKSRRMWITWLYVSLHLHLAITKTERNVFFRSKVFEDAEDLLTKAVGIYERIPEDVWPAELRPSMKRKEGQIHFPEVNSYIYSVSSGVDKARGRTASAILFDEFAFQEDAEDAFKATKPTIEGGGRVTIVSTPPRLFSGDDPYFRKLLEDRV